MHYAPASSTFASPRRTARTILVVDGSADPIGGLAQSFGDLGYLVVVAEGGIQALELASAGGFDIVLVDADVPDLPGAQVVREIRGSRDTADLPVIMVGGDAATLLDAFAAGADDHVRRPVDFAELAARVARVLVRADRLEELKRSALALDARIAARAIELGEARSELARIRAERARLVASVRSLSEELDRA